MEIDDVVNSIIDKYFYQWISDDGSKLLQCNKLSPDDIENAMKDFAKYATKRCESEMFASRDKYLDEIHKSIL